MAFKRFLKRAIQLSKSASFSQPWHIGTGDQPACAYTEQQFNNRRILALRSLIFQLMDVWRVNKCITHFLTYLFISSLVHLSLTNTFTNSHVQSLARSLIRSLNFTHSLTHSFTR